MIIVTGAAGFIGSNVVRELNRRGETDVLAVDTVDAIKHRNLARCEIEDLLEPDDFLESLPRLTGVRAVVHEGACSDTTETDGVYLMRNNYRYTRTLVKWCLQAQVPLVYASSAAVYGDGARGFAEVPEAEDPLNLYAYSKCLLDRWVRRHAQGKPVVGLRYFNVYGPHEQHKGRMASVVSKFHGQARAGEGLRLFEGSDGFRRDFVYVRDAVAVTLHFAARPGDGGIYNVGCGQARSFEDVARLVAGHTGAAIEPVPFPDDLRGKYQAYTQADPTRLRAAGYDAAFTSLEDGVGEYLDVLDDSGGFWAR